jgi:hypothetical protein
MACLTPLTSSVATQYYGRHSRVSDYSDYWFMKHSGFRVLVL